MLGLVLLVSELFTKKQKKMLLLSIAAPWHSLSLCICESSSVYYRFGSIWVIFISEFAADFNHIFASLNC